MWFKNLRLFQLPSHLSGDAKQLHEQLLPLAFTPCLKHLPASHGFAPPLVDEPDLVVGTQDFLWLQLQCEDKIVPATVVREQWQERLRIAEAAGRKPSKSEKMRLKDEITQTLLTQAFSKMTRVHAFIDTQTQTLLVNTANPKRAQLLVTLFQKATGIVPAPLNTVSVPDVLTQWLMRQNQPNALAIEQNCLMKSFTNRQKMARFRQQDLQHPGVTSLLQDNHTVTQLTLHWTETLRFTIKEDFSLSGLQFSDSLREVSKEVDDQDQRTQKVTNFLLMASTLRALLADLTPQFITQT